MHLLMLIVVILVKTTMESELINNKTDGEGKKDVRKEEEEMIGRENTPKICCALNKK
jgi:hypothetical protein